MKDSWQRTLYNIAMMTLVVILLIVISFVEAFHLSSSVFLNHHRQYILPIDNTSRTKFFMSAVEQQETTIDTATTKRSRIQNKRNGKEILTYKQIKKRKQATIAETSPSSHQTNNNNNNYSEKKSYTSVKNSSDVKEKTSPTEESRERKIDDLKQKEGYRRTAEVNDKSSNSVEYTRTKEEEKRSMERMDKAKQLLEQLMVDNTFEDVDGYTNSSGTTNFKQNNKNEKEDGINTVADNDWYNGNLQQGRGDFVTRWAKGKKVAEPLRKYDPVSAEKILFRKPSKWVVRNVQIGFPLALWVTGVLSDIVLKKEESNRRNRAKQLLQTISGLGPAIIKGGQALASRSDLLPSEYLEELQKLQDDVPRFDNEVAFATVEKELGIVFDDVFELIYNEPIAAASIGQVYKARLVSNGDMTAIKIQRPRCEEVIALDLYVLRWWGGVANVITNIFNRDIDVQNIIDDFGDLIYRELDYVAEAANAQRFSELYASQKRVFVPKVYNELTTSKVLTMEWVDGCRLTDNENLERYGLDRKKLVDSLVQCSLRQILENGYFHADPHAGNLLACTDGRLCYLDFGMMSYANLQQRNGFLLAVIHIVNRDWDELVRMYQRLGFIPPDTDLRPIEVALENTLPDALNSEVSELNFKNVVGKLGDIMYTYPFSLPPFYISIIRCLGVLEGLAIQVDPQARIISDSYPYIASRVLTDSQNELQEALRRLALSSDGKIRWNRLEGLLDKAKDSQGYDVSLAVEQLTSYLLSEDGEQLLSDLTEKIVEGVDTLGLDSVSYLVETLKSIAINDEVSAAKAIKSLQGLINAENEKGEIQWQNLVEMLPEPTQTMKQSWRILLLLGARNSDPSKMIPIIRKLGQEPKIQSAATVLVARIGERLLSRGLRLAFGLPQPTFRD